MGVRERRMAKNAERAGKDGETADEPRQELFENMRKKIEKGKGE